VSKLDRILISILVAAGAPLAVALGNLSAADLHHPGQWIGALILGLASAGSLLIHYWLQQSPIQLQSPIVRAPATPLVPAADYTTNVPTEVAGAAPVAEPAITPATTTLPRGWVATPKSDSA
jgi:hypothetical protein